MPVNTLCAGEVHHQELGRGSPLVLLHANPGDTRWWSPGRLSLMSLCAVESGAIAGALRR